MEFRTNQEALDAFRRFSMPNYDPAPVAFARGEGCRLWDVEGRSYLDFAAGVAVASLGHSHPALVRAISEQAQRLIHTSNLYLIPNQLELAQRLLDLSGLQRAFFCNSGTEAMEAALKLARYWGSKNGGRTDFVATNRSFHGRTLGALSATGQTHYQRGFEPLLPGVSFVPFGDPESIRSALTPKTCAVVLEPIQGEGGVNVAPPAYLREVRSICDDAGVLLIFDEVQTGIGRTGHWFAFERAGATPDVLALAKGLGGGFPIGAVLCNDRANAFGPGAHGSTFGGNPLAAAAALATLAVVEKEDVLANVRHRGEELLHQLQAWEKEGLVARPRGQGLLVGFDLPGGGSKSFARALLGAGLLVSNIGDSTIRICPPLIISKEELREGLDRIAAALVEARVTARA